LLPAAARAEARVRELDQDRNMKDGRMQLHVSPSGGRIVARTHPFVAAQVAPLLETLLAVRLKALARLREEGLAAHPYVAEVVCLCMCMCMRMCMCMCMYTFTCMPIVCVHACMCACACALACGT
jgi:hypothetical protein